MKIIIDADAVPRQVLEICQQASVAFSVKLITVANFNHRIDSPCHLVVGDDPQAADIRVVNLANKGDIVITQDWGLAALVLARGAAALTPKGLVFHDDEIPFYLENRETMAKARRSGKRLRGPKKRSTADDERFKKRLYRLLEKLAKDEGPNI